MNDLAAMYNGDPDREIYRQQPTVDSEGGSDLGMEPYVFVTATGAIGISYYGKVSVRPIKEWSKLAWNEVENNHPK